MSLFDAVTIPETTLDVKINWLDEVYNEITRDPIYEWQGSFSHGDYIDLDSVEEVFRYIEARDEYESLCNPIQVRRWVCCHKIARTISRIKDEGRGAAFDMSVKMRTRFEKGLDAEAVITGMSSFKVDGAFVGELVDIGEHDFVSVARAAGEEELATTYESYKKLCKKELVDQQVKYITETMLLSPDDEIGRQDLGRGWTPDWDR